MWWEILPSAVIMTVVGTVPIVFMNIANKLYFGSPYARHVDDTVNWWYFQRDRSHAYPTWFTRFHGIGVGEGDPYRSHGLEQIKDSPPK